jgi:peptide/nickel transport system substrate-binding protein
MGEHDMFMYDWTTMTGESDFSLHSLFHSENIGRGGNRSFHNNPEVDRLLDEGRRVNDPVRLGQLYFEAQQIIRNEAPWIFLWAGDNLSAACAELRGLEMHPTGQLSLRTAWFDR